MGPICVEAASVSNVGCEVGQRQNEFQFHTSKHDINHPITIDTNYHGIWTNEPMGFIPAAMPDRTASYRSTMSGTFTGTAAAFYYDRYHNSNRHMSYWLSNTEWPLRT